MSDQEPLPTLIYFKTPPKQLGSRPPLAMPRFVCGLDKEALERRDVVPQRGLCADCGFLMRFGEDVLARTVLEEQVAEKRVEILKEYGLTRDA